CFVLGAVPGARRLVLSTKYASTAPSKHPAHGARNAPLFTQHVTECGGISFATRSLMGVRRYQDLDAWRLANELKREVCALIENSPGREDRRFCDQIKASASSSPANLAEGFGCYRH